MTDHFVQNQVGKMQLTRGFDVVDNLFENLENAFLDQTELEISPTPCSPFPEVAFP